MNEKLFAPNTGIPQLGIDVEKLRIDVEKQKLPDLSATPQILPYQFMGQPVYVVVGTIGTEGVITALPQYPTYILSAQGMKDSNSYPLHIVYDNGVWKTTDEGADTLDFVYIQYVDNYVDLGLPSGKKWNKMNVGATTETDYGLYFQWGDISGYTSDQVGSGEGQKYFGWADYKYCNGTSNPGATGMTKYNSTDGKTVLDLSDDAARANVGFPLRIPTKGDFQELFDNTDKSWTSINGVNGYKFQHKQDSNKYIFFPAAGSCGNGSVDDVGSYGNYWSSSLSSSSVSRARHLYFSSGYVDWGYGNDRCLGFAVRGVVG